MIPSFKPSLARRCLSYLWPVTVFRNGKQGDAFLEILLYKNRFQLATQDALYSDGDQYAPFRLAFKALPDDFLKHTATCLVLGAGLGSVVQILNKHYNKHIAYTIVEINEIILQWALSLLIQQKVQHIQPFREDAAGFVSSCKDRFDLVCIDVFIGRNVPRPFTEKEFLFRCRRLLTARGICIINYMIQDLEDWQCFRQNVQDTFKQVQVISKRENRILVCREWQ